MSGDEITVATTDGVSTTTQSTTAEPARPRFEDLPPPAQRALKEAEERRQAADAARAAAGPRPKEIQGRDGPEPVRYGDWERKGIISDF
ncbi:MAG: DUF1674 domain-containing protein [Phyllobacteriaceae bacterium]|nr:DUF1674 domain-containing protein [Phyllobacteriaceae bacterium]